MGETVVRVVFGIVKNLAFPILLGTQFIGKFFKGILPAKSKIVPYNSQPVPILMVYEASSDNRTTTRTTDETDGSVMPVKTEEQEHFVRVARAMTLQPMFTIPFLVRTSTSEIGQVDL